MAPGDANLTFGSDGRLSGNAGCNTFFGEHSSRTARSTHVRVSDIGITQMACPDRADWMGLLEALTGKLAITVDGASATLTSETGAVVELEFLGPNPPRQPLDDPDQPVSTVNEG
jgi:heat shock protein HslJ